MRGLLWMLAGGALAAGLPGLQGQDLTGRTVSLPAALGGEAVVLVGFQRAHQPALERCWTTVGPLAAAAGRPTWELVPLPSGLPGFVQGLIAKGKRKAAPGEEQQRRTAVVATDVDALRAALEVPGDDRVQVLVVDAAGQVRARLDGPCDDGLLARLGQALTPDL